MFGWVVTACMLVLSRQCIFEHNVYDGGRQVPTMSKANFESAVEADTVLICTTHFKQYYEPTELKHAQVRHSATSSRPYVVPFSKITTHNWWNTVTPGPTTRLAP